MRGLDGGLLGLLALGAVCLAAAALAACVEEPAPSPPPQESKMTAQETSIALPAPLYYSRAAQIWRRPLDGGSPRQITHEALGTRSFDVSPADGALAFVTGNTLVRTDGRGADRQVLLSGPELPEVVDELTRLNAREHVAGRIATPVWSPDGSCIAYIQNGLKVMTLATGEVETAHPNDSLPVGADAADRLVIDEVISWSPDGRHLLVSLFRHPLRSVYHRKVALKTLSGYLRTLGERSGRTFAWHGGSEVFYGANRSFGGSEALSRCAVADGRCTAIGQDVPARTAYFYGYPHVSGPEELRVFLATSGDRGDAPHEFRLFGMGIDGSRMIELRKDRHSIDTALWAPDGRGVLVVTGASSTEPAPGSLAWLPVDGSPPVVLPVTGARMLRWGT